MQLGSRLGLILQLGLRQCVGRRKRLGGLSMPIKTPKPFWRALQRLETKWMQWPVHSNERE